MWTLVYCSPWVTGNIGIFAAKYSSFLCKANAQKCGGVHVKIIKNNHRGWESVSGKSETFWFGQENGRYSNIWPSSFEYSSRKDLLRLFHLLFKKGGSELKNIDALRKKN